MFSNTTLSLCTSFNNRTQVSHLNRITGKIVYFKVYYVGYTRIWTEWFHVLLIYSLIHFWFVSVTAKYVDLVAFAKDPSAIMLQFCPAFWWWEGNVYLRFLCVFIRSLLVLSSHLCLGLLSGVFPFGFPITILVVYAFQQPNALYMPYSTPHLGLIMFGEECKL
jgi:hypothetical protein